MIATPRWAVARCASSARHPRSGRAADTRGGAARRADRAVPIRAPGVSVHRRPRGQRRARAASHRQSGSASPSSHRDDSFVTLRLERREIVAVCPPGTQPARRATPGRGAGAVAVDHHAGRHVDRPARPRAASPVQPTIAVETSHGRPSVRSCSTAPASASSSGVGQGSRQGARLARLVPALARTIGLCTAVPLARPPVPSSRWRPRDRARPALVGDRYSVNVHFPAASGNGEVCASSLGAARHASTAAGLTARIAPTSCPGTQFQSYFWL